MRNAEHPVTFYKNIYNKETKQIIKIIIEFINKIYNTSLRKAFPLKSHPLGAAIVLTILRCLHFWTLIIAASLLYKCERQSGIRDKAMDDKLMYSPKMMSKNITQED